MVQHLCNFRLTEYFVSLLQLLVFSAPKSCNPSFNSFRLFKMQLVTLALIILSVTFGAHSLSECHTCGSFMSENCNVGGAGAGAGSGSGHGPGRRIVDISHAYREDMPVADSPEGLGSPLKLIASMKNGSDYNFSEMKMGVHSGTHVDSPGHFYQEYYEAGLDVDTLDLDILTNGHLSYEEEDEGGDAAQILYRASFEGLEENYVNYQTARWLLFSLLLILAWGVGFIMLLYLPLRRYIVRQDFRSRKLYVTSNAIVYKVTKPVFLPCFGVTRREKHVLLPLVTDVVIEQGCLQAAFGIFSMRIENAGFNRPPPVDDVHIVGVVNPGLFRKAVLMTISRLRKEHIVDKDAKWKISINKEEELPIFSSEIYSSSRTWGWPHSMTGLTSWQMSPVNSIEESNSFQSTSGEMLLHKMEEVGNLVKKVEVLIENQHYHACENDTG